MLDSIISGIFSSKAAKDNRDFQEEMSNTAHQREARDLEAAGLNRILGATGSGASTPGGAVAQTPDFTASRQANSARQLMKAQTNKTNAEAAKTEAETENTRKDGVLKRLQIMKEGAGRKYYEAGATADYEQRVAQVLGTRQGTIATGVTAARGQAELEELAKDRDLMKWVLSKDKALADRLDKAIKGDASPGEYAKILLEALRR